MNQNRVAAKLGGEKSKELGTNFSSWDKEKQKAVASKGGKKAGPAPWWTNGIKCKKVFECPGDGWVRGRIYRGKVYLKENV